jgi:hypothetical protein
MSLAQAVVNYIAAYEGHTSAEGVTFVTLRETLQGSTINQIITENNALTQQHLWNSPLMDLFFDELLRRLLNDTSFSITTSWNSIQNWMEDPYIVAWVGFEESYPIVNPTAELIGETDENIESISLGNISFTEQIAELIIKMLMGEQITAEIYILPNNKLTIGRLINAQQSFDYITLSPPPEENFETMTVPLKIWEVPDWSLLNQLYQGLRRQTPVIGDPWSGTEDTENRLINQLIDLGKAKDIAREGGFTFEGDLLLTTKQEDEEED